MATPVTIVAAGGLPVTNIGSLTGLGTPMTPVAANGLAVTVVAAGGLPCSFVSLTGVLLQSDGVTPA